MEEKGNEPGGLAKSLASGLSNAARAPSRAGRGAMGLLFVLALAGGLGVLFLRAGNGADTATRAGASTPRAAASRSAKRPVLSENGPSAESAPRRIESESEADLATGPRADPTLFRGHGTLRGHVEIYGDLPAPEQWSLLLRPSHVLFGAEHAEERELTFRGDQLDFEVGDLPLGGYDVQALAAGRNGLVLPVLLTRKNPSPFVVIGISPASHLEGYVVDGQDLPVEGIELTLETPDASERLSAATDAAGYYRFEGVRDGAYRLLVGSPLHPFLPTESLRIATPGMRFPTIELPPLGTLSVFVLDEDGLYLPNARVRGTGTGGGVLDGVTDADGHVVFPNLVPGRFRLRAEHPTIADRTSRRAAEEVNGGETVRVELRFLP